MKQIFNTCYSDINKKNAKGSSLLDETFQYPYCIKLGKTYRWSDSKPAELLVNDSRLREIKINDKQKRNLVTELLLNQSTRTIPFENWKAVDDQQMQEFLKFFIIYDGLAAFHQECSLHKFLKACFFPVPSLLGFGYTALCVKVANPCLLY